MPNVLVIPALSSVYFSNDTAGASVVPSRTASTQLRYNGSGGLIIEGYSDDNERLIILGGSGELFSVRDSLTGNRFTVRDQFNKSIFVIDEIGNITCTGTLTATHVRAANLTGDRGFFTTLSAENAFFVTLSSAQITTTTITFSITGNQASFESLTANQSFFNNLSATSAVFSSTRSGNLTGVNSSFDTLTARTATIEDITIIDDLNSPLVIPPLPVPKVELKTNTVCYLQYVTGGSAGFPFNPAGVANDLITLYNPPVIHVQDITQEIFSKYQIFCEMVIFKTKRKEGRSYVASNGLDVKPWGQYFWTRNGSYTGTVSAIRINHLPVTSSGQTISACNYLNNHLSTKNVEYKSSIDGVQYDIELIAPKHAKRRKNVTSISNPRFGYSGTYQPLYIAFRYIAWLPKSNGTRGQIISGPLTPIIRVVNKQFPFNLNHYQSSVFGYPVVDVVNINKKDFICKFL